jgi:hypothetical protein
MMRYDLRGQTFVNFRTVFEMMLNALKLTGAPLVPTTLSPAKDGPGALLEGTSTQSLAPAPVVATSTPSLSEEVFGPPAPEIVPVATSTPSLEIASSTTTASTSSTVSTSP